MTDVLFDIKLTRRSRTLRKDKNRCSVMPLKPFTFLIKNNPTDLPDFSKPAISAYYFEFNYVSSK